MEGLYSFKNQSVLILHFQDRLNEALKFVSS